MLKEVKVHHINVAIITGKAAEMKLENKGKENQMKKQVKESGTLKRRLGRQEKLYEDILRSNSVPL